MYPSTELLEIGNTWVPPEELQSSCPREIRLTGLGKFLRLFSIILIFGSIVAGILLYLKASADLEQRQNLIRQGVSSSAQIIRQWKTGGKETRYWIEYAYRHDEQTYQGRIQIGRRDWANLTLDSQIPVRHLPDNPQVHYLPGREGALLPLWIPFLVSPFMIFFGWLTHHSLASQSRLLRDGRPAPAVVTGYKKAKNGQETQYTFLLLNRAAAQGKMETRKNPPPLGSVLCVLYESDRHNHNQVYPLSMVQTTRRASSLKKRE